MCTCSLKRKMKLQEVPGTTRSIKNEMDFLIQS
jgi:hypothetical protein